MTATACPDCTRDAISLTRAKDDLAGIARVCARAKYGSPSPKQLALLSRAKDEVATRLRYSEDHMAAEHGGQP